MQTVFQDPFRSFSESFLTYHIWPCLCKAGACKTQAGRLSGGMKRKLSLGRSACCTWFQALYDAVSECKALEVYLSIYLQYVPLTGGYNHLLDLSRFCWLQGFSIASCASDASMGCWKCGEASPSWVDRDWWSWTNQPVVWTVPWDQYGEAYPGKNGAT